MKIFKLLKEIALKKRREATVFSKKNSLIFFGLILLSLQAVIFATKPKSNQSLTETLGLFLPPSIQVSGKSAKSAEGVEFLITFFEKLDSQTFDPENPAINNAAKAIASRTAKTIVKGLKNSVLELTTAEKLFVSRQLKLMSVLLLRIDGLSDQCKQEILKAHRLISSIFNPSAFAKIVNVIDGQKAKLFTFLGLIAATFGTLATFHAFKISKTADQTAQDIKQVSGLCAAACQAACDNPEKLTTGLNAVIDVVEAKKDEIASIMGAFSKTEQDTEPPLPDPTTTHKKGFFDVLETLCNNPANHPVIERLASKLGGQAINLKLAPEPAAKKPSTAAPRRVLVGRRPLRLGTKTKTEKKTSPITEAISALEKNPDTRDGFFGLIGKIGSRATAQIPAAVSAATHPSTEPTAATKRSLFRRKKANPTGKEKQKANDNDGFYSCGEESDDQKNVPSLKPGMSSSSSSLFTNPRTNLQRKKQSTNPTIGETARELISAFEDNPKMRRRSLHVVEQVGKHAVTEIAPQIPAAVAAHSSGTAAKPDTKGKSTFTAETDDFDSGDESSDPDTDDSCKVEDGEANPQNPLTSCSSSSSSSTSNPKTVSKKKKVRFKKNPSFISEVVSAIKQNPEIRADVKEVVTNVAKEAVRTSPQFATTLASAAASSALGATSNAIGGSYRATKGALGNAASKIWSYLPTQASAGDCGQGPEKPVCDDNNV